MHFLGNTQKHTYTHRYKHLGPHSLAPELKNKMTTDVFSEDYKLHGNNLSFEQNILSYTR